MSERTENPLYRERIAAFSGLMPEQVDPEILELHRDSILDMMHDSNYVRDYIDLSLRYTDHRRFTERMNSLVKLTEGLLDVNPEFVSYGLYALNYLAVLHEQKKRVGSESHVALLVGAMTTITINEFVQTLQSVFKDPTPLVIDIEGRDTAEESKGKAHFVFADALHQPFKPGSVDTVHTNNLLEHLQSYAYSGDLIQGFFEQSFISLKEGGQLILVEKDPNEETDDFKEDITADLIDAGFKTVRVEPAYQFSTRRNMDDYFAGINDQEVATDEVENMKVFIATK